MTRIFHLLYAAVAYAIFLAIFLYLVAFTGNLPGAPLTVDRGPESPIALALPVNLALIALFGLQHSVMARPSFKAGWTRLVPPPIERATFVMTTNLVLAILFLGWHPMNAPVWTVENATGATLLWALFGLGWAIVLVSTFLISCSDCNRRGSLYMQRPRRGRCFTNPYSTSWSAIRFMQVSFSLSGRPRR